MIYSMTAFARLEKQGDWGGLTCEIKSINHRYLEIGLYLPEALRVMEMPIRERLKKRLKRGKVDCGIRYQQSFNHKQTHLQVNTPLAQQLVNASEKIASLFTHPATNISVTDILRFPAVLETPEADVTILQTELLKLIEAAVDELVATRGREGEELKLLFLQRLDLLQEELSKVRNRLPQVLEDQEARLLKRFAEAKIELDPNRLEQEIVMFAQKIDISEEIDRTATHVTEIRRVLKQGGMVGRRLDFLLQELNREANTLGSKSVDPVINHIAVEMKVLIEQVREQVQNVE